MKTITNIAIKAIVDILIVYLITKDKTVSLLIVAAQLTIILSIKVINTFIWFKRSYQYGNQM